MKNEDMNTNIIGEIIEELTSMFEFSHFGYIYDFDEDVYTILTDSDTHKYNKKYREHIDGLSEHVTSINLRFGIKDD